METIPIDQINIYDRRFCISHPLYDEVLFSSIKRLGIIQPIILLNSSPFLIITGFKRLESAIKLGYTKIPCTIVDVSEKEALLYSIHDNIKRGLNIVEKAYSIEKMLHMGFGTPETYETMTILGLEPHEKVLKNLIAIAYAEEPFKDFIITRGFSMKNIETLLSFDMDERRHIIQLFSSRHITESSVRETLQMISILKIKRGQIDFNEIIDARNMDDLKKRLKKMINPILSSLEERLKNIKHQCALPPNMDIKVDPFFEKEYIDIWIRAKGVQEIEDAIEKLGRILENGHIRGIFELTKD